MRQRRKRVRLGRFWLAGFVCALTLYLWTLAPGVVWQDSGDYQVQAGRLNLRRPGDVVRAHPWFIVVAHGLARVGPWSVPRAANMASALGTALAVANVMLLVVLLTGRTWPAIIAGMTFGLGHTVWRHAVIAETYGWTAALLSAECLCAWAYTRSHHARWLVLLLLINGVAVSNHLMAGLSLAVFGPWLLVECWRGRVPWYIVPVSAGCWLLGGTLYWIAGALEYVRTESVAATLHAMTVGRWGSRIFNVADLPRLIGRSVLYVGLNYPTPLVAAGVTGVVALGRRRREPLSWLILVLAGVYWLWAARYNVVDQYAFFVPFYVFGSTLIGLGVWVLWRRFGRASSLVMPVLALVPIVVYAVLPAAARKAGLDVTPHDVPYRNEYRYFLQPWKSREEGPRRFAEEVYDRLPRGAVLFADSTTAPPLVYMQEFEGRRPDVLLVCADGLRGTVTPEARKRYWWGEGNLLPVFRDEGRRVFVASDQPAYMPRWMAEHVRLVPFDPVYEAVAREETAVAADGG